MELHRSISEWISDYANTANISSLVVGVSGGIDSAVVSTLCANTGLRTIVVSMPIKQKIDQHTLSIAHCKWLANKYENVEHVDVDLTQVFTTFETLFADNENLLALANSRSRLRMTALYQIAQSNNGLVVGTGNKVEDFGIGFFTKYGDGGVDISPIADLMKTEVWELGKQLGVSQEIIDAQPTDGLWDDGRVDADQLHGLSYPELERAMILDDRGAPYSTEEQQLLDTYLSIRKPNLHKMQEIPIFKK
jgi:NAD+ synthase